MAYVSQTDKKELSIGIKKVLKKYNMKGTIAVRHHSTLVVNIQSGAIQFDHTDGDGHTQVNPYWIHEHFEGVAKEFLTELLALTMMMLRLITSIDHIILTSMLVNGINLMFKLLIQQKCMRHMVNHFSKMLHR